MSNIDGPTGYEPPTSAQLLRSTLIALGVAVVVLVAFVLPSEYGVDPTGVGTALGLTRMGQIKGQLAAEAEAEAETVAEAEAPMGVAVAPAEAHEAPAAVDSPVSPSAATPTEDEEGAWRDETVVEIAPDEAAEFKLLMKADEHADYAWTTDGGGLNFNAHGHGGGQSITYSKGRGAKDDAGTLSAPFDGHHGWFWRNRTQDTVSLTLRTRGQYSELKRTR